MQTSYSRCWCSPGHQGVFMKSLELHLHPSTGATMGDMGRQRRYLHFLQGNWGTEKIFVFPYGFRYEKTSTFLPCFSPCFAWPPRWGPRKGFCLSHWKWMFWDNPRLWGIWVFLPVLNKHKFLTQQPITKQKCHLLAKPKRRCQNPEEKKHLQPNKAQMERFFLKNINIFFLKKQVFAIPAQIHPAWLCASQRAEADFIRHQRIHTDASEPWGCPATLLGTSLVFLLMCNEENKIKIQIKNNSRGCPLQEPGGQVPPDEISPHTGLLWAILARLLMALSSC